MVPPGMTVALKGILADIHDGGHVGRDPFPRPAVQLPLELELAVIDANDTPVRSSEVKSHEERQVFAQEEVHLIVAVEVALVGSVTELCSFQDLIGYGGVADGSLERWEPIKAGDNAVLNHTLLHLARPASNGCHAEAALADDILDGSEPRHAAIRLCEHFGAIVGGENDDGVVGLVVLQKRNLTTVSNTARVRSEEVNTLEWVDS
jgi:hypothetical protein